MREKLIVMALVIVLVLLFCAPTFAHPYYRGKSDHPLRYLAYLTHPFGMACEYLITRPIHWVVSQPDLDKVFGHVPTEYDIFFVWE